MVLKSWEWAWGRGKKNWQKQQLVVTTMVAERNVTGHPFQGERKGLVNLALQVLNVMPLQLNLRQIGSGPFVLKVVLKTFNLERAIVRYTE